jgi:hypothetical protein
MERGIRNAPNNKRVFGKDITNLERRPKVNSISEKPMSIPEFRTRSQSFDKKITLEIKDPIT